MIRIGIVDDSAFVRKILNQMIDKEEDMEVVCNDPNPYRARDNIVKMKPDVLILDIEMPRMDGLTFLKKIMTHFPLRVIIVSSLASDGSENAVRALEYGALKVLCKPQVSYSIEDMNDDLINSIREVYYIPLNKLKKIQIKEEDTKKIDFKGLRTTNKIIAIGASTGGTEAILKVLKKLPKQSPPILIVQHMPKNFTKSFANRLNSICDIEVKEAKDKDILHSGLALIAPGDMHLSLKRSGAMYYARVQKGEKVCHQIPSVDVLFESVAIEATQNAVGIILTGMGSDGAKGLLKMKEQGAYTIAQDEESSVVYGMPKKAWEINAAYERVDIDEIANSIILAVQKMQ